MIKKVLYVIASLFLIYLVLCLFGPKKIQVDRSVTVKAPAEIVKTQLSDFKFFQEKWSPWSEKDPNMKTVFEGETGMPGSKYTWEGNKEVGKGSMELIGINGDTILQKIIFTAPRPSGGDVYLIAKPMGDSTHVTWGMNFKVGFLGRGAMLFMNMDKRIGNDYEKGLSKFKEVIESMPIDKTYGGFEIKEVAWTEKTYFGKKAILTFDKLDAFFEENFPKIFNAAISDNLEHTGPPSGIFYTYDEQKKQTECVAAISVPGEQKLKGWEKFTLPASDLALHIECHGGYPNIKNANKAIEEYMKEKGLTHSLVIEEYIAGPLSEKEPKKWITNIYYIINTGNIQVNI
jgi:effector-binding domain-containing protein